jgi:hypothetical protein
VSQTAAIWRVAREQQRLQPLGLIWRCVGSGHATIDLDAAESRLRERHAIRDVRDADDELLGARCRIVSTSARFAIVLLEPSTEGRLAAALAKYGQDQVSIYLRPIPRGEDVLARAAAAGLALSAAAEGPFGRQRLVAGGPRWGPFVLIVEASRAATIEA